MPQKKILGSPPDAVPLIGAKKLIEVLKLIILNILDAEILSLNNYGHLSLFQTPVNDRALHLFLNKIHFNN